jgi:hypothetical protein
MHIRVVFVGHGQREFTSHEIVRDVPEQLQIRPGIEQIEREMQVGRHAVPMCFDIHREVHLLGEPRPSIDQLERVIESTRPYIRLQVDVMHTELGGYFKDRLQVIYRTRKTLSFCLQAERS